MKVLITGANGFSASYLISLLSNESQLQLFCTDLQCKDDKAWHPCDLADYKAVYHLLDRTRPQQIYHLAGSFSNEYEIDYRVNVLSTKNILDNCLRLNLNCRVLLIGSSAEYGIVSQRDNPVKEDHPLNPVSIYGLTKTYQTHLMQYYHNVHNTDIVMARTFNIMGKGISNRLFIGRIYEQIDEYKKGNIPKIILGNLQNNRDYIDIKEAVKDYKLIMEYGVAGEIYNVGSGKSIKIYDLLNKILNENYLSMDVVEEKHTDHLNKLDIKDIYADITKLSSLSKDCDDI
ncbi:MAG: GDP-mannose 4,6-dehydratase [Nitrospirota bacterium]